MEENTEQLKLNSDADIEITPAELIELIQTERAEAALEAAQATEERIRSEYTDAPTYRGILGGLSWVAGLIPDSRGKPSSSWTLYLMSHIPVIVLSVAIAYALIMNHATAKAIAGIPVWLVLIPMVLSWIAWLAHHEKLAKVVISVIEAVAKGFASVKGSTGYGGIFNKITASVSSTSVEVADKTLNPGQKIKLKKRTTDKPKTDPSTLPETPDMS